VTYVRIVSRSVQGLATPLHWAAFYGRTDAVRVLLAAGADNDARDVVRGQGTPAVFRCLTSTPPPSKQVGKTPADKAREQSHADVLALLETARSAFTHATVIA
jgi:ankyrin repeat protein